jgi:alpha-beta hydrolase superfamily lysophospholipase
MTARPFYAVRAPQRPRGLALVLHGGRAKSTGAVRAAQLAVVRMAPFGASLARAGASPGLAVARMRYLVRGWNGTAQAPVADVRWVLDQLAARYPDLPVALVGHSMGGRAAIYAADHPAVRTVVALAPWVEPGDPYRSLAGRSVLVVHGDGDRMTSPRASAAWTRQAATVAERATYVSVRGDGHAMLRRAGLWHELATRYVLATVLDRGGRATGAGIGEEAGAVLGKVLAGEPSLVV